MRVISKARLREFWKKHPDAEVPLTVWWKTTLAADWTDIQELRKTYPHADAVRLNCDLVVTVFNIAGNRYRLITQIIYDYRRIYVKMILTHAEYSKDRWRRQLCEE
jgi:mRNA interferase HigB